METLKILMTTTFYPPHHIGGDAMHVYYLANELAKLGHEIHIIYNIEAYRLKRGSPKENSDFPNNENVHVYPMKSPLGIVTPILSHTFGVPYPVQTKILTFIKRINPDVVHHHNISGFGPFIFRADAPKVLYTAHDYWLICPMNNMLLPDGCECNKDANCFLCSLLRKRPPQLWRYWTDINNSLTKVDTIIAPSKFMKSKLKKFGIECPISVIYNFVPDIDNKDLRDLIVDGPYFLFVGILEQHKGILQLVETFLKVKDKINAKLVIAGSGSLESKIWQMIQHHKVEDKIVLLGKISTRRLFNLYSNALATIIPSVWPENNPLVALESISAGAPVITSNKGGLPEITSNIDKDLIFDTFGQLQKILLNFDRGRYSRKLIRDIYIKHYSPAAYIQKYMTLVKK